MSWRMDKNKFWHGGRLFSTTSPRLGTPTQFKARSQDGRSNATQGTSASWAPQHNTRHVRKLGAPTHVCKMVAQTKNSSTTKTSTQGSTRLKDEMEDMSASWAPQRNARHVRNANARHVRTSASWMPHRNIRHVRKLGAQTQHKTSSQDGRPKEKLIHNENFHTREH
jgi:hypothetical protein